MRSSLNKWVRQFHRWFAVPAIILVLLLIFLRQSEAGSILLRFQQVMAFVMAVTGSYLLLLPYITRRKRARKKAKEEE